MSDDTDELEDQLDDLNKLDNEINNLRLEYDIQERYFVNWLAVYQELIKVEGVFNSSFNEVFASYFHLPEQIMTPSILRLHYVGFVSAYEGFVRGVFNSMVAHEDICGQLLLMVSKDDYKHSDSLMNLNAFKGRKNKEELLDSFYKSSFASANKLALTLDKLFGIDVDVPDELHEIIAKRNVFIHNSGLNRDGTELKISGDDLGRCHSVLRLAVINYLEAIKAKSNESRHVSIE